LIVAQLAQQATELKGFANTAPTHEARQELNQLAGNYADLMAPLPTPHGQRQKTGETD
jgi:hypothetical protein